ncbi:MAG: DUF2179 domain-containing protein, partial [Paramuribaculum sp.]|nr:DUF2179 domain-containing protein [Paramuribaculum sp.]
WDAKGYWTGNERKIMLVWCRMSDSATIQSIAWEVDPRAYITTCTVRNLYGNGFDALQVRKKAAKRHNDHAQASPADLAPAGAVQLDAAARQA